MKKFILLVLLALCGYSLFGGEEITAPGFEYVFILTEKNDVSFVYNVVKEKIAQYQHWNCTIENAEVNNTTLKALIIQKLPPFNNLPDFPGILIQFYYNGKRIDLFLAKIDILGLTQPYNSEYRANVFERFYNLAVWNMEIE